MKNLTTAIILLLLNLAAYAQDTAFVSRELTTALFFNSPVKLTGEKPVGVTLIQKDARILTLKAGFDAAPATITVCEINIGKIYRIPVVYSYGRAGRRIEYGRTKDNIYAATAALLAAGKRKDVADHDKSGGVKAWVSKLSIAGNRLFFRVDLRNKSNLPFTIDFVRFYIRDLNTVSRMATHEQELLPVYASLLRKTTLIHRGETAGAFAFKRFSLSEDQALAIEIYERDGNRRLCLKIKGNDLSDLKIITAYPLPSDNTVASVTSL